MKAYLFTVMSLGLLWVNSPSVVAAGAERLKVIYDTDIDGDNDDVAATAILHAFADAGRVEILAMGVVSRHAYSPACLDAINTYYGRGDIPIGVYKGTNLGMHGSSYAKAVAERCPNDAGLSDKVPRDDGFTRWNAKGDKQHFYNTQKLPIAELEAVMEQLLIKPPKRDARGR